MVDFRAEAGHRRRLHAYINVKHGRILKTKRMLLLCSAAHPEFVQDYSSSTGHQQSIDR